MDVSDIFKAPAPKTDPTKMVPDLNDTSTLGKRNRPIDGSSSVSSHQVDAKRSKAASKGKQRARSPEEDEQSYWEGGEDEEGGRFFGDGLTSEQKEIIDILNHDGGNDDGNDQLESAPIGLVQIKKMCLDLERAINRNREMRTKFIDRPEKFVDSEFELSESITKIALMTQDPAQSYPELGRLGILGSLVGLLSHENVDIAISVIEILQELTDDDVLENQEDEEVIERDNGPNSTPPVEALLTMVRQLVDQQLLEMLVSTLVDRLSETEEAERNGVFHCLGLIENLVSLEPTLSASLIKQTPLMQWLLNRIRPTPNTTPQNPALESLMFQNTQYASEILAIILQKDDDNRKKLVELGGMDTLLEVLSVYRKRDPKDADEIEFMENVFDALCSVLLESEHKEKFLEGEGVELMIIMMKQKKLAKHRALKVLDHALSGDEGSLNCERFVERLGLKTLFALFMGKRSSTKQVSTHEDDEHILGIIVSLFFNLGSDSEARLRLLAKFVEEGYEKVDRLIEIREGFEGRVQHFINNSPFLEAEMDETEIYLMKLDAGLFALQLTDVIIGWLCMEDDGMRDHLKMLLKRKGQPIETIVEELKVYGESMGEGGRKEGVEHLIGYLESL